MTVGELAVSYVCSPLAATVALAASWASGTLALSTSQARAAVASDARVFSLNENGSLHLTSKHGFTLNEQGSASGTVRGTIYVHLSIVSSSHVTAEVNIYPTRRLDHRQRQRELSPRHERARASPAPCRSSAAPAATRTRAGQA